MWLLTLLGGYWCSEFKACHNDCSCLANGSPLINTALNQRNLYVPLCCANKEESDTASQNKKGTWCRFIDFESSTNSKIIASPSEGSFVNVYCFGYVDTIYTPPRTPVMTPAMTPQKTYPKNKITYNVKNKFNVLMSVLSFILNE